MELIRNEPAVLLRGSRRKVLIVADLHIGYERTLVQQENYSSKITEQVLQHLDGIVERVKPTEIIILGDLKHTIRTFSKQEFRSIALGLARLQQRATLTVVRGNHDADLELVVPDGAAIIPSSGFKLSFGKHRIYLLHGHAQPTEEILSCQHLLMAHVHPVITTTTLKGRKSKHRVWVKTGWQPTVIEAFTQWFGNRVVEKHPETISSVLDMKILVIPAFLDLLHGHVLNNSASKRFQGNPIYRHLNLNQAEIVMLDHTYLGTVQQLHETE
ncbi:MAG: metallophosphoesterase [Promethearchaeota archaeon]